MTATLPELKRRLLYRLFQPAVGLARQLHVPLDEIEQLCRLAYFEELRRTEGLTQAEVAKRVGRSLRTVTALERELQSDFLAPAAEVELARRVEEALGAGPASLDELVLRLGSAPAEQVQGLVAQLCTAGHVFSDGQVPPRYALTQRFQSLVHSDLLARLDGLKHQLEVLSAVVKRRFFPDAADSRPSVARTLAFVGRSEDVEHFAKELVQLVRHRAVDLEEKALGAPPHDRYAITFALVPTEDPQLSRAHQSPPAQPGSEPSAAPPSSSEE
jgi:DNA-binding XRE family transcriptional regulator